MFSSWYIKGAIRAFRYTSQPHRDTEKEVNMFGTLVFQLPTSEGFTGGEFTVTHQGATKTLDMSTGSESEFSMVSFYADCEHEL